MTGYHLVNLSIHLLNSIMVYFICILTFRTPFFRHGDMSDDKAAWPAFIASALYVSHPVQTEAVTYIFQRLASLATFFYLCALLCYLLSRLSVKPGKAYFFYAVSFLSAVLGMLTKEIVFTLPVALALYEFYFFDGNPRKRIIRLVPILFTMLIIPTIMNLGADDFVLGRLAQGKVGASVYGQWEYLVTQASVLVTYLRVLVFPVGQNIDYVYPVYSSLLAPRVLFSLSVLLGLFAIAAWAAFGTGAKRRELRLVSFGIIWFFLTISIESSIIPLGRLINEYRMYLPSVGIFISTGALLLLMPQGKRSRAMTVACVMVIVCILSVLTYKRNMVWQSNISLWEDTVSKSPGSPGAQMELAMAYHDKARAKDAMEQYLEAIHLSPGLL